MNKMKFLSAALAAVIAVSGMSLMPENSVFETATAETATYSEESTYEKLTYEVVDDEYVRITGCDGSVTYIDIPDEIDGYPVREIGEHAFSSTHYLSEVKFGIEVKKIGDYAFSHSNIKEIVIPEGIEEIGIYAFWSSDLTEIDLPDSLREIGSSAFNDTPLTNNQYEAGEKVCYADNWLVECGNTAEVETKSGTKGLANSALLGSNAQYVKIGNGVEIIGDYAFGGLTSIETIEIADSVTTIGDEAFYYTNCEVTLPAKLTELGTRAFASSKIKKIVIPDKLTVIKNDTFYDCNNLEEVIFGSGLNTIDSNAFTSCDRITEITFPENVSEINWRAFEYCSSLEKVVIENPECVIAPSEDTFGSAARIYGYTGSTAQEYAKKYNRDFIPLDVLLGDANSDGDVNVRDCAAIAKALAKNKTDTLPASADFNGDGEVTVRDAAAIARWLAKGGK